MNNFVRNAGLAVAITVGAGSVVAGSAVVYDVMSNPDHSEDIADLTEYTSPEGNEARCATTRSLDFQRGLHEATEGEMDPAVAKGFADALNGMGMEINGEEVTPENIEQLAADDLSKVPGFDCDEPEGASTFVVINTLKTELPFVLAGLALMLGGATFGLGVRSGRKYASKGVK